jgi:hypothetical protein
MKEAPGLFHKQPRGGVGAPPWGVLELVARGSLLYFFCRKKSNKKPRDEKNSLLQLSNCIAFWFAVSLVSISLVPLFGFMAKKRPSGLLGQFFVT